MARIYTKIGDFFTVHLEGRGVKYFQLVAFDLTQLNSDVIRVFKELYPSDNLPPLAQVELGEIDFFAHCVVKFGVKRGLWEKIGNLSSVGHPERVLFRDSNDYGQLLNGQPIKYSKRWYVWNVNEEFRDIDINDELRQAEIGIVVTPDDIVERMSSGRYGFFYPEIDS